MGCCSSTPVARDQAPKYNGHASRASGAVAQANGAARDSTVEDSREEAPVGSQIPLKPAYHLGGNSAAPGESQLPLKSAAVQNGAVADSNSNASSAAPTARLVSAGDDGDDWDNQNASSLDPQAYLKNLAEQGDGMPSSRDEDGGAATAGGDGGDDDDYHKTLQQVRQDHEAAQAGPSGEQKGSGAMYKAANSERAKRIQPALSQDVEPFRMTSSLCVAVYQGCVFFNQYLVVKFVGKGACGKVYLVMDTLDSSLYALKITQKNDFSRKEGKEGGKPGGKDARPGKNPLEDLRAEVAIMGRVRHPNMVCLKEVVDDPQRNKVLIVMNYAEGGPILPRKAIAQGMMLPEDMCRHYFRDILRSLEYLHSQKIIHGDLKPENILLTSNGEVKLSDFGCSRVFVTGNEYFDRFRGTPAFLAPEIMKRQTHYRGRPVDVYAMGVCLYALVFGTIPFSASNLYKLFQRVQEEPVRFPEKPEVSPTLKSLLEHMLTKEPKARIAIPELRAHAWVTCDGAYPMRPFKELFRNGLLQYDADPPVHNYLKDMLQLKHRYVTFATGTMVIQQGEVGYYLALIVEGQAEVCVKPRPGGDAGGDSGSEDAAGLQQNAALLRQLQQKALEAKAAVDGKRKEHGLYCIATRRAGDVLGEMALVRDSRTRKATVVATTPLKVALYTYADIDKYGKDHPGAIHQLKQLCWKRDAELMHFAAMYRLAEASSYFAQMQPRPARQ